ncbi:MAG: superoxide dismutase, Ni [Verrucomicrobiota bacterium]
MNKNPQTLLLTLVAAVAMIFSTQTASAHCQIPCGIYDDDAQVKLMLLDATTIKKSATEINNLAGKTDPQSANQLARWVTNKEAHAENVINTISNYFLTQRVKASQSDYAERLKRHHAVMVAAMKCKQSADPAKADELAAAILVLRAYYPETHKH